MREKPKMGRHHKFSIWYFIIGIWIVIIVQNYLAGTFAVQTLTYSEFLNYLQQGKIVEVAVTETEIQGRLKPEQDGERDQYFKTIRVQPEISELLNDHNVQYSGAIQSTFLRDLLSWLLPVFIFLGVWFFLMKKMMPQQPGFMNLGKSKAKIYKEEKTGLTFDDVAGVDEAKVELEEIIDFLKNPDKFTDFGGQMPKGLLLVGPPGTGKTMLAKAVAGESNVTFFSISGSEFVEMFVGLGAARVRDLFEEAKKNAPCIIFIDELDALGKARGAGGYGGHDEREQTLNQLLVELDGFDANIGVILMAATNRPEVLDPALLRPGRFDRQVLVDRPDKEGRKKILEVHLKKIKRIGDLDLNQLASMTAGMVGADLANLVNEATLLAVRGGKEKVEMPQFEEAVERVVAGLEKKNRLINRKERKIVAYHELGHAIVSMSLPDSDPIQKITIVPRGIAALGYTMQLPTEDRFLMSKSELLSKIATLLGGRAAEKIVFNEISTGAHNDLSKATDIARSMIIEYGMSEKLGQAYLKGESKSQFLYPGLYQKGEFSEETSRMIDQEVRRIIEEQYEVAVAILKENRDTIERAVKILLDKEKITGNELREIMGQTEPVQPEGQDTGATAMLEKANMEEGSPRKT